jgi:hypothetical protein
MATYKLSIDDFDEPDYALIAIHTPLEDYRLAFCLNRSLNLNLRLNSTGVSLKTPKGEAYFSRFTHVDGDDFVWELLQNKAEIDMQPVAEDLFGSKAGGSTRTYLLPEFKKVDYLLKIDAWMNAENQILEVLSEMEQVATAYIIDTELVKSRNNLILLEHANSQKDEDRSDAWAGL